MKRQYRILATLITAVMLLGSMVGVASGQNSQSEAETQQGDTLDRPAPDPDPAPEPEPEPEDDPAPAPEPEPDNDEPPVIEPDDPPGGPSGGNQSGAGSNAGQDSGLPPREEPEPDPVDPPSTGGDGDGSVDLIVVDLSSQYLTAYDDGSVVLETYVSTGEAGFETPTGTFYINNKFVSDDMEGTISGDYYNVPNVPDAMYFTNRGHAIHGTYWHSNFGTPMSHGCVNLPLGEADWLYKHTPYGAKVVVQW